MGAPVCTFPRSTPRHPGRALGHFSTMSATHQDKRLRITIFIVLTVCGVLFPVAFNFGIFGVFALITAALALQHFIAVFRPRSDVCWGAGTMVRFRLSRLST